MEIETSVKSNLKQNFSSFNQPHCRTEPIYNLKMSLSEKEQEQDHRHRFCETQQLQFFDLLDHLERNFNIFPIFGFNNTKYDRKSIKSYLLPLVVNQQDFEPLLIEKATRFVSPKFGDYHLLDKINFLGRATTLKFY